MKTNEEYLDIPQPRGSDTTNFFNSKMCLTAGKPSIELLLCTWEESIKSKAFMSNYVILLYLISYGQDMGRRRRRFVLLCLRASAGILYVCSRELGRVREREKKRIKQITGRENDAF